MSALFCISLSCFAQFCRKPLSCNDFVDILLRAPVIEVALLEMVKSM